MRYSRRNCRIAVALAACVICGAADRSHAQQPVQNFSLEFFFDSSTDDADTLQTAIKKFAEQRKGLKLHFQDVKQADAKQRLDRIGKYFRLKEVKLPAVYGLKNIVAGLKTEEQLRSRLEQILTLTAYVREGCPHCRAAKEFLGKYQTRYPALRIVYREVITDAAANDEMYEITKRYQQQAASLPVIHYCNGLTIGFDREETTGRRILQTLDYWSKSSDSKKSDSDTDQSDSVKKK